MEMCKKTIRYIIFVFIAIMLSMGMMILTVDNYPYFFLFAAFIVPTILLLKSNIPETYKYFEEINKRFFNMIFFLFLPLVGLCLISAVGTGTSELSSTIGTIALVFLLLGYGIIFFNLAWILYYWYSYNERRE